MGFTESIKYQFTNYANFKGRASRSEFWWWYLFLVIVSAVLNLLGLLFGGTQQVDINGTLVELPLGSPFISGIAVIFSLVVLIPNIGIAIRRLHDSGKTGWWLLIGILLTFVCGIGLILLLVFYLLPSTPGDNQYGPNPLQA